MNNILIKIKKYFKHIRDQIVIIPYYLFRIFPINERKIVISNYYGKGFSDNGKYIVEEILRQNLQYEIVWLCKDVNELMPSIIRKVRYKSIAAIKEMVTAQLWIDNCRKSGSIRKRKGQFYIQTWHSPLRLKVIEKDAKKYLNSEYIFNAKKDARNSDLMIAGCDYSYNIYRNSFWFGGEIIKSGTPRCDIFFKNSSVIVNKVYDKFKITNDDKLVLFAPTFRNNSSVKMYTLEYEKVLKAIHERFGGNWRMLVRLHPNVSEFSSDISYNESVINASFYDDMQELLCAADILITDYSSCMFDMAIANKKCFLYAQDIDDYISKERELYFNFDELPFCFSRTTSDLKSKILSFDEVKYSEKLKRFNKNINLYEDGNASQRIVGKIKEVMIDG